MLAHNVAVLLKAPLGESRDVDILEGAGALGPELDTVGPICGSARLLRTPDGILVRGRVHITAALECSRCLDPVEVPVDIELSEEFQPTINVTTGLPLPEPEDAALRIDEHHILDLREATRQYVLTSLPLRVVCRDSCLGLCPDCGANRNTEPCSCATDAATSPFASLARVFATSSRDDEVE